MSKRIIGAVGVGDKTFTAGQEAEMEAAIKASGASVDWDRLEAKGVVIGYGKAPAAAAESTEEPAPKAAKKAARKR